MRIRLFGPTGLRYKSHDTATLEGVVKSLRCYRIRYDPETGERYEETLVVIRAESGEEIEVVDA